MSTIVAPKLTRLVRDIGRAVIARFEGRKFSTEEYEAALDAELAKTDLNHPEYRHDIARTFAVADIAERSKLNPFKTDDAGHVEPALFHPGDFARGVIRLGDRTNVRMIDATAQQWVLRQLHQQRAAEAAQHSATQTTEFLQTPPGLMLMNNPRMRTLEAMRQMRLWAEDEPIAEAADHPSDDLD